MTKKHFILLSLTVVFVACTVKIQAQSQTMTRKINGIDVFLLNFENLVNLLEMPSYEFERTMVKWQYEKIGAGEYHKEIEAGEYFKANGLFIKRWFEISCEGETVTYWLRNSTNSVLRQDFVNFFQSISSHYVRTTNDGTRFYAIRYQNKSYHISVQQPDKGSFYVLISDISRAINRQQYGQQNSATTDKHSVPTDKGVVINGVKWATRNVASPGTFAAKPEDAGMFYQWNRKKAWAATGVVTGWDSSYPSGTTWGKSNDPSPAGWRVPTFDEIKKLLDTNKVSNEWTTQNGVNGRKFTDKTTGNSIFLPAVGYRTDSGGTLDNAGTNGVYWSSTQYDNFFAYYLYFSSGYAGYYYLYRRDGQSVRAVAENKI